MGAFTRSIPPGSPAAPSQIRPSDPPRWSERTRARRCSSHRVVGAVAWVGGPPGDAVVGAGRGPCAPAATGRRVVGAARGRPSATRPLGPATVRCAPAATGSSKPTRGSVRSGGHRSSLSDVRAVVHRPPGRWGRRTGGSRTRPGLSISATGPSAPPAPRPGRSQRGTRVVRVACAPSRHSACAQRAPHRSVPASGARTVVRPSAHLVSEFASRPPTQRTRSTQLVAPSWSEQAGRVRSNKTCAHTHAFARSFQVSGSSPSRLARRRASLRVGVGAVPNSRASFDVVFLVNATARCVPGIHTLGLGQHHP